MAKKRATNSQGNVPVRFGRTGRPVPVPRRTLQKSRRENRLLYEDGTMGPRGSRRPPRPPRRGRRD